MIYAKLLLVVSAGDEREFDVEKEVVTLGRDLDNDIVVPSPTVSRHHARLTLVPAPILEDLGSSFGTMVGDERITQRELHSGDVFSLAGVRLRFELPPQEDAGPVTVVDLSVPSTVPDLQLAAHRATLTHTLLDVAPEVTAEARRQDATLQVVIADTGARLVVREQEVSRDVALGAGPVVIGRGADSQVVLSTRLASRRHAEVRPQDGGYAIVDLGSANGTAVNGNPISAVYTLHDGDMVTIGEALIIYRAPQELEAAPSQPPEPVRLHADRSLGRRPVVVIPGLMGSELRRGNQVLWPNYAYLMSHPFALMPESGAVEVAGIVHQVVVVPYLVKHESYSRLTEFLEKGLGYQPGIDLLEFPYDWRMDNRLSAQQLAAKINAWRETLGHGPVTIIAHSMGGLVTRYYLDQLGGREHVERFIVMGTPHAGTAKAASVLIGGVGGGPFGMAGEKVRTLALSGKPTYQILPFYPCVFTGKDEPLDIFRDRTWLAAEHHPLLQDAADFHASLTPQATVSTLCVVGYGRPTISRINVVRREIGWKVHNLVLEPIGDGGVSEQSAILDGAEIHPVHQDHGALFSDPDVQRRLRYELTERRVA